LGEVFKETKKDKIKYSLLLYKLARKIQYELIKKGDTVFRIGEKGEKFYLILKGNVHILKFVQILREMTSEKYLELLYKLKKDREYYRLKKTLMINRQKFNIDKNQIDTLYEYMIRKKLALFLQEQPNYSQIIDFLKKYDKELKDYHLDSKDIKTLFNLNTQPKKSSILINNQRINVLNDIKNKNAYFVTLKRFDSYSKEESDFEKDENISFSKNKNEAENNQFYNDDSLIHFKTKIKKEKDISVNFNSKKLTNDKLNKSLSKLENITNSMIEYGNDENKLNNSNSITNSFNNEILNNVCDMKPKNNNNINSDEQRNRLRLEKAKEGLIQIFNIDINRMNKKFFIEKLIKSRILNDNTIENDKLFYNIEETQFFCIYEYQNFHSLSEGEYFGDYALEKNSYRTASIIAGDEDTHFAVIDKKLYYDFIYEEKINISNIYRDFLYNSIFKDFIKKGEFEKKYFENFIYEEHSKNHIFFKENEEIKYLYFIFEGSVLLNSKKNYFDIKNDLDKFQTLNSQINYETNKTYYAFKYLEDSKRFQYNLKSFSEHLCQKRNWVKKIISKNEIFGLENYVFNLPSYFTYIVNSDKVCVFKLSFKLLKKILNTNIDVGTATINRLSTTKMLNLIHRLFEVKKSFIDILRAKKINNNTVKYLYEQINDKYNYVYKNNSLSNLTKNRSELIINFKDKSEYGEIQEYNKNLHKSVDIDNKKLNFQNSTPNFGTKIEDKNSITQSFEKSIDKSFEKFDNLNKFDKPHEIDIFLNRINNKKHRNNLLIKNKDKNIDEDDKYINNKTKFRKVLNFIDNESVSNKYNHDMKINIEMKNNYDTKNNELIKELSLFKSNYKINLPFLNSFERNVIFKEFDNKKKIFKKENFDKESKCSINNPQHYCSDNDILEKLKIEKKKNQQLTNIPNNLNMIMKINLKNKNDITKKIYNKLETEDNIIFNKKGKGKLSFSVEDINNTDLNKEFNGKSIKKSKIDKKYEDPKKKLFSKSKRLKKKKSILIDNSMYDSKIKTKIDVSDNLLEKMITIENHGEEEFLFDDRKYENGIERSLTKTKHNFDNDILTEKTENEFSNKNINNFEKTKIRKENDNNIEPKFDLKFKELFLDSNEEFYQKITNSDLINNDKEDKENSINKKFELIKRIKEFTKKNDIVQRISRLIKDKKQKQKIREISHNNKLNLVNFNNSSNLNKDNIFTQTNYKVFKLGSIGNPGKTKNEKFDNLENKIKKNLKLKSCENFNRKYEINFDKKTNNCIEDKIISNFRKEDTLDRKKEASISKYQIFKGYPKLKITSNLSYRIDLLKNSINYNNSNIKIRNLINKEN